jgi:hypothetical protein
MALQDFIPTIWAANALRPFYKALVWGTIANRDYEGEIRGYGDSVKINEIGDITVSDYAKFINTGSTSTALSWQALTSAQKLLTIDKAKSFSFAIDSIDQAQTNPKVMAEAMNRAAYAIANQIDADIATACAAQSGNIITATTVSSATVLTLISQMARKLDEANVPQNDRYLIVPPFIHQDLVEAFTGGIGATAVPKTSNDGVLLNGYVGSVYGFNVLMSNNYPTTSSTAIVTALHRSAVTFAGQLTEIEAVRRESYFDYGVKGLYLYGVKVVRPSGIVTVAVTEG